MRLLLDHKFLSFKPSVVTAAAIAAARSCLQLTPTWKPVLVEQTKYEYFQICECVDLMLKYVAIPQYIETHWFRLVICIDLVTQLLFFRVYE